jgi:SdrD B-like domain
MFSQARFGLRLPSLLLLLAAPAGAAEIGGTVFIDGNVSGTRQNGETGLSNILVSLRWDGGNGIFGDAGDTVTTQTSDAAGAYNFTGVAAGNYRVDVATPDRPPGLTVTAGSSPLEFPGVTGVQIITTAHIPMSSTGVNLTLWTVNEADPGSTLLPRSPAGAPRLFCFTDYTSNTVQFIDYGQLVWTDSGGNVQTFPGGDETNAESLAIDTRNGDMYIIVNGPDAAIDPVLFKVNLYNLRPNPAGGQLMLTRVGRVENTGGVATKVEGIAFDEPNNLIYAVNTEGNRRPGALSHHQSSHGCLDRPRPHLWCRSIPHTDRRPRSGAGLQWRAAGRGRHLLRLRSDG